MLIRSIIAGLLLLMPFAAGAQDADMIITGARIWTGDANAPWAEAVAVRGNRILAAGSRAEVLAHLGAATRVMDLPGRFIAPGFIDNHTHFGQAGALLLGANLLDVASEEGLIRRVREARDRLPAGAWITGGDWGAYEAWAQGSTGQAGGAGREEFRPTRFMIDSITPVTPVLLSKWDRSAHLANTRALEAAGAGCDWPGVECDQGGRPTGRVNSQAAARIRTAIPAKSMQQRLMEARVAQAQLSELGVTTIHDNTPPDQFPVFQHLRDNGELSVRINARPTLDKVEALRHVGIEHGFGDDWLRIGGLKGFVDGIMGNSSARFYEPYATSGELGIWRPMMSPAGNMERLLFIADSAGHWPQIHAIGDAAIDTLLSMFERVIASNPEKERRLRIIHTQVIRDASVAQRMARNDIIAEVQPYHAIDDMRWMEERIGNRARWAYAFRTLQDAGVRLSFGSDWPGTNASWYTANPLHGIYAAVTRQTLDGQPAGGWFPEERVDLETALRAYTINNAFAAGEERVKGSITAGKLADLVVLDRDPFGVPIAAIKDIRVLLTLVDGRVVYESR
jgi:predicted amidohydrolase YtcJ